MAKTTRIKAATFPAPQSADEVRAAIQQIGEHQRDRLRIETEMNDELAEIKRQYEERARPHAEAIAALQVGVQAWCEAHRQRLTEGKRKYYDFGTGEIKWRMRPPSVRLSRVKVVLEVLKQLGLERFIRTKEEVDKEKILADPDSVKGVKGIKIEQVEDFVIVPFETKLEEVA